MKTSGNLFRSLALSAPILLLSACGANTDHQLQSITLTPSSATVAGSKGTVQFVATGHYNQQPLTETPLVASWSYTGPDDAQIVLTQEGQASCKPGQSGTFTIAAWIQRDPGGPICNAIGPGGAPCSSIAGGAQLICP